MKNRLAEYGKMNGVDPAIGAFAGTFALLQEERLDADYDPQKVFTRPSVNILINRAAAAIVTFIAVPLQDRRDLAAYLLLFRNR